MNTARRFLVKDRSHHAHGLHILTEVTFEAAAAAYLEGHGPATAAEGEVQLVVHDLDTGAEHCFRIDLASGESRSCD
ncbi:MAG TPA: DUF5961 family protein [Caulobacteraceae bacterium]|jgi:5,10-methylenetetrahydrofolate reductase|nr:DUF5961 family protein [Caulobacteraceae bacterium]